MTNPGEFQKGNPYNGREPRFYATVATDGNTWGRPRPADAATLDPTPLGRLQAGKYEVTNGDVEIEYRDGVVRRSMWGVDTRQGPIEDWNGSWTGYYEKKLIDTSIDAQYFRQTVPHVCMRLAEMYLIAAEACILLLFIRMKFVVIPIYYKIRDTGNDNSFRLSENKIRN